MKIFFCFLYLGKAAAGPRSNRRFIHFHPIKLPAPYLLPCKKHSFSSKVIYQVLALWGNCCTLWATAILRVPPLYYPNLIWFRRPYHCQSKDRVKLPNTTRTRFFLVDTNYSSSCGRIPMLDTISLLQVISKKCPYFVVWRLWEPFLFKGVIYPPRKPSKPLLPLVPILLPWNPIPPQFTKIGR